MNLENAFRDIINELDFSDLRGSYRWPKDCSHEESIERIEQLNMLVRENVYAQGGLSIYEVLRNIVQWKSKRSLTYFSRNRIPRHQDILETKKNEIINMINRNDVRLEILKEVNGVGPAVASAFVRFLDLSGNHGILDSNNARFFNERNLTNFYLRTKPKKDYWIIKQKDENWLEYKKYNSLLRKIADDLNSMGLTYYNVLTSNECEFLPVDIDMAIFTYMTI